MYILLVCAAGASSTCMAQSMNKAAIKLGRNDITVKAHSEYEMEGYLDEADVCLIGPHLKNLESSLQEIASEYHVPAKCISSEAYGTLNGALGLQEALQLLEEIEK